VTFLGILLMVRFSRSPVTNKLHPPNDLSDGEETNEFRSENSSAGNLCTAQVSDSIRETGRIADHFGKFLLEKLAVLDELEGLLVVVFPDFRRWK